MSLFCCRAFGAALSAALKLMGGGAAPPPKPSPKVTDLDKQSHDLQVRSTSIIRFARSAEQVVGLNPASRIVLKMLSLSFQRGFLVA